MIKIHLLGPDGLPLIDQTLTLRAVTGKLRQDFQVNTDHHGWASVAPSNNPQGLFRSSRQVTLKHTVAIQDGAVLQVETIHQSAKPYRLKSALTLPTSQLTGAKRVSADDPKDSMPPSAGSTTTLPKPKKTQLEQPHDSEAIMGLLALRGRDFSHRTNFPKSPC